MEIFKPRFGGNSDGILGINMALVLSAKMPAWYSLF